jgi:hypothetical protein
VANFNTPLSQQLNHPGKKFNKEFSELNSTIQQMDLLTIIEYSIQQLQSISSIQQTMEISPKYITF